MRYVEPLTPRPETVERIVVPGQYGYEIEVVTKWITAISPSRSRDLGGGVRYIPLSLPRLKCLEKDAII